MADYIDRETALAVFHDWVDQYGDVHTADEIPECEAIENLPAADVEPVRHGRWILDDETGVPICSECHSGKPTKCVCSSVIDHKLSNYEIRRCYFCGAKMDGRDNNG